jgi:ABC-type transport system substrate-binding protein
MTAFNALFHKNHPALNPLGRLSLNLANTMTPIKNALFRQAMWMGISAEDVNKAVFQEFQKNI